MKTMSGHRPQPILDVGWDCRPRQIEPELDGCRDLVDVLSAGAGRTHEAFGEVGLVDRDAWSDGNRGHGYS